MENNLENKARFFAQYWGQKIVYDEFMRRVDILCVDVALGNSQNSIFQDYSLTLKPLSSITDEDAIGVAKFEFDFFNCLDIDVKAVRDLSKVSVVLLRDNTFLAKIQVNNPYKLNVNEIDYLRSKGYATPYMGLSVETMVEYGWIKLI